MSDHRLVSTDFSGAVFKCKHFQKIFASPKDNARAKDSVCMDSAGKFFTVYKKQDHTKQAHIASHCYIQGPSQ